MIPVHRGAEPPMLVETRNKRLRKAVDAFNAHGPGSEALLATLDGYDFVKKELYLRQHRKCAYCERKPGFAGQPVEHFRPKRYAVRRSKTSRVVDHERYWWLAWTWQNLLFACATCNGQANKGNQFPLSQGTTPLACPARPAALPLPASCFDVSSEQPLLLDPSDESIDPLDHLRWLPIDRRSPRSLWTWELRDLTVQGRKTKEILGLDDLADEVGNHYRRAVWPRFHQEVERKLGHARRPRLLAAWNKLVRDLVSPSAELTAATWSMLDVLHDSTKALGAAQLPAPLRP